MPRKDIELDLAPLYKMMTKTASKEKVLLKEALNSARFAQVGIGVFRDSDSHIWKLEQGEDGTEYIIRAEDEEQLSAESNSDWAATPDATKKVVTLSYKGMPLCKFASKDYGFDESSASNFADFLLSKTSDARYVKSFYAISTGKCPDCGQKPLHVGASTIVCATPGCPNQK